MNVGNCRCKRCKDCDDEFWTDNMTICDYCFDNCDWRGTWGNNDI